MTTKYRINGKATKTGKTWHGTPIFDTEELAQYNADSLNVANAGWTTHWVELVEVDEEEQDPIDITSTQ